MKCAHNLKANTSILSNFCLDTLNNIFEFLDFVNLLNLSKVDKSLNKNIETLIKDKINNFTKKYNIELLNFLQIENQNFCNIREFLKKDYDIFAFLCIKNFTTRKTKDILIRTVQKRILISIFFPLQMVLKTIFSSTKTVTLDLAYIELSPIELNLISSFLNFKFGNCWNIELNYTNSQFHYIGFIEIMKNLKVYTTITKLNLKNFKIHNYGAEISEALAEGLVFNKSITELNLTNTEIFQYNRSSYTKVLEALKKNTHLTKLDLSKNYINKYGIEKLIEVLKVNTTLTNISISYKEAYNEEISSYQKTIKAALLRNKKLTILKNKETKKLSNILVIIKSSVTIVYSNFH
jgi:hypothetical protein